MNLKPEQTKVGSSNFKERQRGKIVSRIDLERVCYSKSFSILSASSELELTLGTLKSEQPEVSSSNFKERQRGKIVSRIDLSKTKFH